MALKKNMSSDLRFDKLDLSNNPLCQEMMERIGISFPSREQVCYSEKLVHCKLNINKQSKRVFLITDKAIYILLPLNYSKCKARHDLESIESVSISTTSNAVIIFIKQSKKYYALQSQYKEELITVLSNCVNDRNKPYTLKIQKFAKPFADIIYHTIFMNDAEINTPPALLLYGFVRTLYAKNKQISATIYRDILFFCQPMDYFSDYNHATMSVHGCLRNILSMNMYCTSLCFGGAKLSSMVRIVHQWKFQIIQISENMVIGIYDTTHKFRSAVFADNGSRAYGLKRDGYKTNQDILENNNDKRMKYRNNDIVEMELDLSDSAKNGKGKLLFSVNGGKKETLFADIERAQNIYYCMAVCMDNDGASVCLMETDVRYFDDKQQ